MSAIRWSVLFATVVSCASAVRGGDVADKKLVEAIAQEIELVPGLYVEFQEGGKAKELPTFSAKRLAPYAVDKDHTVDKERARWKANKEKYAKDFPLRAAVFEAADSVPTLTITMVQLRPLNAKATAAVLERQKPVGMAIFKLEQSLAQINEAEEQRAKETSKRWHANFDFARLRVEGNIAFLMEHNYALGQVRAAQLPNLGPAESGWKLVLRPKLGVTEAKAKDMYKKRSKLIKKIQDDYFSTPWDYFAERENKHQLGLQWTTMKAE